jgi:hypothetical protein
LEGSLDVIIDLGDATLNINLRVKGLQRLRLRFHVGIPRDTSPEDRIIKGPPYAVTPERVDFIMDLAADQQVPLSVEYTDEVGNPVPTPAAATVVYTVDDPTIINLTDNGDGTAIAAAVGALGAANVHVEATFNGTTLTGDLQIVVVAGLAERLSVIAGPPSEVTPD